VGGGGGGGGGVWVGCGEGGGGGGGGGWVVLWGGDGGVLDSGLGGERSKNKTVGHKKSLEWGRKKLCDQNMDGGENLRVPCGEEKRRTRVENFQYTQNKGEKEAGWGSSGKWGG